MKIFTTIKVGYTAGVYGCTNEYFTTIIVNGDSIKSLHYYGLYGAEERIQRALIDMGYDQTWTPSVFGKLKRDDIPKNLVVSEAQALEALKTL